LDEELWEGVERVANDSKLELALQQIFHYEPIHFDDSCIALVRQGAQKLGYSARGIVSGAGHDACYLSRVAPTAMIFVPCIGGISHNEIEDAKPEWIEAGANVLLSAILAKANESAAISPGEQSTVAA
jgi:beta-ureidopropionase / N-carbamoyl-L-amino-acid hydrolase